MPRKAGSVAFPVAIWHHTCEQVCTYMRSGGVQMPASTHTVPVVIEGLESPGRTCAGPDAIGIGIQRRSEVEQVVPSGTASPRFSAGIEIRRDGDALDFRGPFVHGPKGDRFLYLAWVSLPEGEMVARIKLKLNDIDPQLLAQAWGDGDALVARLSLRNRQGKPATGSVRPPNVAWTVRQGALT